MTKKEKEYTYQEVMKLFPIFVDCGMEETCEKLKTSDCKTCLRNKFHIKLTDNYKTKGFIMEKK